MLETKLIIGPEKISIDEIYDALIQDKKISLSQDRAFLDRIAQSRELLERKLAANEEVYGVTTGYGDSYKTKIPKEMQLLLPIRLATYHRCGLGEDFSYFEARAIQLVRIINLTRGYSAISLELIDYMISFYNHGLAPRIPKEGSVGASGDLTPLAYYAAALMGEGEVYYQGELTQVSSVYDALSIRPIMLKEKEGLALMNGTAVMSALACLCFKHAENIGHLASRLTAFNTLALLANASHFDAEIFQAKPHQGTIKAAHFIAKELSQRYKDKTTQQLQDRYSIRCAPHVIGVLFDALESFKPLIEIEVNSANDNPLLDPKTQKVLHGGNFYGGHIAFAMDSLKNLVANIADLLDRQLALIIDPKFNNGLPANLSSAGGDSAMLNHGLKALQISTSAWTAECLKNSMPASVFSRSTECHNQDKVSMGTISARDCQRSIELTYQVLTATTLAAMQAIDIRLHQNELSHDDLSSETISLKDYIRNIVPFVEQDRALEGDLRALMSYLKSLGET